MSLRASRRRRRKKTYSRVGRARWWWTIALAIGLWLISTAAARAEGGAEQEPSPAAPAATATPPPAASDTPAPTGTPPPATTPAPTVVPGDAGRAWQAQNGRFFPAGTSGGFLVADDSDAAFWSSYLDLGGVPALGAPLSGRFIRDGAIHQAFERAVLRWPPESGRAVPVNLLEELSRMGADGWLYTALQVPRPELGNAEAAARLSWLSDSRLRDGYFGRPPSSFLLFWDGARAIELRGLPTSHPQQLGPVIAQRFQRAVLQLWTEPGPGLPPPGSVTEANVGVFAAHMGLVPAVALLPRAPPQPLGWELADQPASPGTTVSRGPAGRREVALTFDDGPSVYTPRLLEQLAALHVRATFYVVGRQAASNLALVRRMAREGHAVGDHTWSHARLPALDAGAVASELARTNDVLYQALGFHTSLFRPPYGALDARVARLAQGAGYEVDLWSDDPQDWRGYRADQIAARALGQASPGAIIVLHDGGGRRAATVSAVPAIVGGLRAAGYELVTVPELLRP